MRQIVLDTETTGLDPAAGHRIIEIGCVELFNRRVTPSTFHRYINPGRTVDAGALEVHGIDDEFLATQPYFVDIAEAFLEFVRGAELVIHNAEFDVEFINHEFTARARCARRRKGLLRGTRHARARPAPASRQAERPSIHLPDGTVSTSPGASCTGPCSTRGSWPRST